MRYMISYDLNQPGRNYQPLWDALAAHNAQRVLLSQWVLRRYGTSAVALRDYFTRFIDANDRLLVTCLDGADWASYKVMVDINGV